MKTAAVRAASLACLVLPLACATDKVTGEKKFSVEWSLEEELAMGSETAPLIEAQYDSVLIDRDAHEYLGGLVKEMGTYSVRKDELVFTFEILDSSIPNAFALPGGYVYITRGLLEDLETEGQFISVLGHELGHVEHQHSMFAHSRSKIAGFPGGLISGVGGALPVVGGVADVAGGIVSIGPTLVVLRYDRGQELQADQRGIYFSAAMGYDPREGIKTFELLQRMLAESGGQLSIFSTHPPNQQRIDEIEATIAAEYGDSSTRPASFRTGGQRFEQIVARLRERAPAYAVHDEAYVILAGAKDEAALESAMERAHARLLEAHEMLPDEPLFLVGLGELELMQKEYEASWRHLERAAALYEAYSPTKGHWKPFFYLGLLAIAAEDTELAARYLRGGEARCPAVPELQYLLGIAEEANGRVAEAKAHYQEVLELTPSDSGIHRDARERLKRL